MQFFSARSLDIQSADLLSPQLSLTRQTSSSQERVSHNGIQKEVHVVVKNTPFLLQLSLSRPILLHDSLYDFKHLALDVALLYDNDSCKLVNYVKTKPCDVKSVVNERGDQVSLNIKIKVLTSQHEDMFFRIRVRVLEPHSKQPLSSSFEVISSPIKVISKPKQLKKRRATKKRSLNDMLTETIQRIEQQQEMQQQSLEQLARTRKRQKREFKIPLPNSHTCWDGAPSPAFSVSSPPLPTGEDQFALSLNDFLAAYSQLATEEKSAKVRRVMRTCSSRDSDNLSEILQHSMNTKTCVHKKKPEDEENDGCDCGDCPYRLELQKIDEFYKDFLATEIPFRDVQLQMNFGGMQEFNLPQLV